MYADHAIRPWLDTLLELVPAVRLFDAHTHTGQNDPDGFHCTLAELLAGLALADARAAVFTMHEPGGYPEANARVLAEAAAADGRVVPFCRVDPSLDAVTEAERRLDAGARGIKLHPRAEGFGLDHPALDALFALAAERRVPVLVHAGRGIPALGRHVLELQDRHPDARVILAHAGISDLGWIWREAPGRPLFFDTAWWNPFDLLSLFALVSPGQILYASDAPYGTPMHAAVLALRCGLQVGLSPEQLAGMAGGQMERLVAGEEPRDLGPAPGPDAIGGDILLDRVSSSLITALGRLFSRAPGHEYIELARLACEVGEDAPQAPVCRSVLALLDRWARFADQPAGGLPQAAGLHLVVAAAVVARTPDVPVPVLPEPVEVGERAPG